MGQTTRSTQQALAHIQAPAIPSDDVAACQRHSWQPRSSKYLLWDAILISTELDMMEIRLRELWDVVDKFIILESTHSLTGNPKVNEKVSLLNIDKQRTENHYPPQNLSFLENRLRFDAWSSKIEYKTHTGRTRNRAEKCYDGIYVGLTWWIPVTDVTSLTFWLFLSAAHHYIHRTIFCY